MSKACPSQSGLTSEGSTRRQSGNEPSIGEKVTALSSCVSVSLGAGSALSEVKMAKTSGSRLRSLKGSQNLVGTIHEPSSVLSGSPSGSSWRQTRDLVL